jgi:Animal haem peroxidase
MTSPFKSFIAAIKRRPTNSADGRTKTEAASAAGASTTKETTILHDLTHLNVKSTDTIAHALTSLASGEPMDDKKLLLENGVSMLQSFPPNSALSQTISDGFISMLWSDLPHPAPTLAGPTTRYRRHDGGGNSPWDPEMGKAGSPYARNVPPMKPKGPNLPDVESVYEALMKREDGTFRKHPSGLNRLFFSFATVVIHECFQTSRTNPFINETSSYVDLSTLYGNTEKEQVRVRTYQNGTIFPDSVASERIMMMPPGVVAVIIMFSRNHNQIAETLLSVNEAGKYQPWDALDDKGKKW